MSYCERHTVAVAVDASGDATAYSPTITGRILNVIYTKTDYANGVDFTITGESSGLTVWTEADVNASKTVSPMQATHTTAGVAETYDGTEAVNAPVMLAQERVKIVVASGGVSKSGSFDIIVS